MVNRDNKRFGLEFEGRVLDAFESNGFVLLKKNQWKKNFVPSADLAKKREYDLVFFNPADRRFYIVECKAHFKEDTLTGLEEVVEFSEKLKNYNGTSAKALIVTNTGYTLPAMRYASQAGIYAITGQALVQLEKNGRFSMKIRARAYSAVVGSAKGLMDELLSKYI